MYGRILTESVSGVFPRSLGCVLVVLLGLSHAVAGDAAAEAQRVSARGDTLLQKADFVGALRAYAAALRKDAANEIYRSEYALLRRINLATRPRSDLQKETR